MTLSARVLTVEFEFKQYNSPMHAPSDRMSEPVRIAPILHRGLGHVPTLRHLHLLAFHVASITLISSRALVYSA